MADYTALRAEFVTRLQTLVTRVDRIEADLRKPTSADWPDRAIEIENDEVLEGLDELTMGDVRQLRAAIERIDQGQYGRCTRCGSSIGESRLKALPSATTCVSCASASH
jgi:RNA polymerase-binding transcription factor DksA